MDRFDRIYALHKELASARRGRSVRELTAALECDASTAKRIIRAMRDYLGAPIVYDRELRAYRYEAAAQDARYELPGLWFTGEELYALLCSHQLLSGLQPGLLDREIEPLRQRIEKLLDHQALSRGGLSGRVRVLGSNARPCPPAIFRQIAGALAAGQRLGFDYRGRHAAQVSRRQISPQRLVHYRDSWYLDAFDHDRQGLRTFALARMADVSREPLPAHPVPDVELDQHFSGGYGLFAGAATDWAVLRFTPTRGREVAEEQWHPAQEGRWLPDGSYELRVPYSQATELAGEILRHGPEVTVLAPHTLRKKVLALLHAALGCYPEGS